MCVCVCVCVCVRVCVRVCVYVRGGGGTDRERKTDRQTDRVYVGRSNIYACLTINLESYTHTHI